MRHRVVTLLAGFVLAVGAIGTSGDVAAAASPEFQQPAAQTPEGTTGSLSGVLAGPPRPLETLLKEHAERPSDARVCAELARHYVEQPDLAKVKEFIGKMTAAAPDNPDAYYLAANFCYRLALSAGTEPSLGPAAPLVAEGLAHLDRARERKLETAQYLSAKVRLLELQRRDEPDPAKQAALGAQIDDLTRQAQAAAAAARPTTAAGTTVPRTPFPGAEKAVRVGGDIRPPKKTVDVPPVYPTVAQQARVQGFVVVEALIGESGDVVDARIVRSIPLLDQAALDAVKQWKFEPTIVEGVPRSLVMMATVMFTLK